MASNNPTPVAEQTNLVDSINALHLEVAELKALIVSMVPQQKDEMLTVAEAATLLKVNRKTILRYVRNKSIPYIRPSGNPNGNLRFLKTELLKTIPPKVKKRSGRKTREVSVL